MLTFQIQVCTLRMGKDAKPAIVRSGRRNATSNSQTQVVKKVQLPKKVEAASKLENNATPLQQQCLDVSRDALNWTTEDRELLQEVKGHLFARDFAAAFGRDGYLRVYAARWSPSRALGYCQIWTDIEPHLREAIALLAVATSEHLRVNVVCLGGGAGAEQVSLATSFASFTAHGTSKMSVGLIDIAAWESVVASLVKRTTEPPELSQYASAAARASNAAMLSRDDFAVTFSQSDVLNMEMTQAHDMTCDAELVTLLFTLNELYTTSVPKTQRLLSQLTNAMRTGSLLLVVDSPGSYSTVTIKGAEKRYPMQWLLDHTLLAESRAPGERDHTEWVKVVSDESRWFRLPQGLQYPMELENMRYQIHLYRRQRAAPSD